MMRMILAILGPLFATMLFGQDGQQLSAHFDTIGLTVEEAEGGVYYHYSEKGDGAVPKSGDYVKLSFKGTLLDGTVFDSSEPGQPFVFQLGYRQVIKGWELGIPLFPVGSKGKLWIPSELAYGRHGIGNRIPPNAPLAFDIEILEVMDVDAYDAYIVELEAKQRRAFLETQEKQFLKDKRIIQDYAIDHKLKAKRLNNGLSYVVSKKGKGAFPQDGDYLKVRYEGMLTDGTIFDGTKDGNTFTFQLGKGQVIPAWEEGLKHFNKGSKGWILAPSKMAYGPMGIQEDGINIPPHSVLIFKIEVDDIESTTVSK